MISDLLPSPTTTFSQVGTWAQPTFENFAAFGYTEAGLVVGALIVVFIVGIVISAIGYLIRGIRHDDWLTARANSEADYWIAKGKVDKY